MSTGHNAFGSFDPRDVSTPPVAPPVVSASETTSAATRLPGSPSPATSPNTDAFTAHLRCRMLVMECKLLTSPCARDLLFEDSEEEGEGQVDYEEFPDEAPSPPSRSTSGTAAPPTRDSSPRVLRTPNPFPERPAAGLLAVRELSEPRDSPQSEVDSAMEEPVVTNDLDDAQSRQIALELQAPVSRRPVARSLLMPSGRDYGFQPRDPAETARQAASQLLNTYVIGPAARTPEELAQRTALRERFLTPHVTSLSEYREQLRVQGQRGSVPPMRTYLVVLQPREDSIYGV
ncbi:unnamed protein product [Phytophthora fragariaefolia]|uniref:Unnamed protein product n=1 Tax=Phytophthora fragariaefolia TaxID=1490495 RepID=A0A9W7CTV9_9STRA|nr:unnamed protein product [Phytophthora fragariaefolia]